LCACFAIQKAADPEEKKSEDKKGMFLRSTEIVRHYWINVCYKLMFSARAWDLFLVRSFLGVSICLWSDFLTSYFSFSAGSSDEDSGDDESVEALPVVKKVARPQGRCVLESALR